MTVLHSIVSTVGSVGPAVDDVEDVYNGLLSVDDLALYLDMCLRCDHIPHTWST